MTGPIVDPVVPGSAQDGALPESIAGRVGAAAVEPGAEPAPAPAPPDALAPADDAGVDEDDYDFVEYVSGTKRKPKS